jgi:hypothetical protein
LEFQSTGTVRGLSTAGEPQRRPEDRAALRDSQPPSLGRNTHSLWGGAKWEKEESNAWFIGFIGLFGPSTDV